MTTKILSYLSSQDLKNMLILNYESKQLIDNKIVYKGLYELKKGKTGFGLNEVNWKKMIFNVLK
jgi:hypothetical protein